jgi:hypothetical protein
MGFEDCANIWAVEDLGRLSALLDQVQEEKQKGDPEKEPSTEQFSCSFVGYHGPQ